MPITMASDLLGVAPSNSCLYSQSHSADLGIENLALQTPNLSLNDSLNRSSSNEPPRIHMFNENPCMAENEELISKNEDLSLQICLEKRRTAEALAQIELMRSNYGNILSLKDDFTKLWEEKERQERMRNARSVDQSVQTWTGIVCGSCVELATIRQQAIRWQSTIQGLHNSNIMLIPKEEIDVLKTDFDKIRHSLELKDENIKYLFNTYKSNLHIIGRLKSESRVFREILFSKGKKNDLLATQLKRANKDNDLLRKNIKVLIKFLLRIENKYREVCNLLPENSSVSNNLEVFNEKESLLLNQIMTYFKSDTNISSANTDKSIVPEGGKVAIFAEGRYAILMPEEFTQGHTFENAFQDLKEPIVDNAEPNFKDVIDLQAGDTDKQI